jgi:dienelactone hydrolase
LDEAHERGGKMEERKVTYTSGDLIMTGYLIDGSRGVPAPGVLIAHEALGRDDRMTVWARKLAEQGYVAFALDLYGETFPLAEMQARHDGMMASEGLMRIRAMAALDFLANQPTVDRARLAAIGFCQGGIVVTELARVRAPILCAIGFHPGLKRPSGSIDGPIAAKLLMMVGDRDPVIQPDDRAAFVAEMEEKGADWQLHIFGGVGHTYTNPRVDTLNMPGFAYDAVAERRAWAMAFSLLDEVFAG